MEGVALRGIGIMLTSCRACRWWAVPVKRYHAASIAWYYLLCYRRL